ncbi:unnamed protein product [Protopolystoma xenopodis]|uniref:Uncharacterized protein n=1 Tax=Protopolystoma xenopodis TaxID=117903 RepID=A0A3S5C0U7_9PLAT|nr:unnamed protein product [Protopolystoma xenopodis]
MILAGSDLSERNNYPCNKIMNIDDSVLDTSCGMGRSQKFAEATKVLRPIVFTESASTGDSHGADRYDSKNWPPLTDHDYSNLPVASKSNISEPPRQVCRDLNSILLSNNTNLSEASSLFNASTWPSMPRPTSPDLSIIISSKSVHPSILEKKNRTTNNWRSSMDRPTTNTSNNIATIIGETSCLLT